MMKLIFCSVLLTLTSCAATVNYPKVQEDIAHFYDQADSNFYEIGAAASQFPSERKLQAYMEKFRTFFIAFGRDSLKLTTEILTSTQFSAAEKEQFIAVIGERQAALHNAFMNRLEAEIYDSSEKK
ncbi:MAG: hypothetical protein A2X86_00265 [Bdellovibrionales bacterium GWA2_49_15]|nr:MAG: hypothetical protein A2X86_00265 [Bdellovibrionales bacterium GWA2_49_15]HAZ14476.1 hypothetical protein [Bdellovibrionales bacterium]